MPVSGLCRNMSMRVMQTQVALDEETPKRLGKAWSIPIFLATHPAKQKKCLVFDSSAKHKNTSLKDHILSGSDINNKLVNVLLGFRTDLMAFLEISNQCSTISTYNPMNETLLDISGLKIMKEIKTNFQNTEQKYTFLVIHLVLLQRILD